MSLRSVVIAAATVGVGLLVFVLARDDAPSDRLQALGADPLATYVPPGGALVDTQSRNEGSTLGKPVPATFRRMFELAPGTADEALEHASAAATSAGWTVSPPSQAFPNVFVGDKLLPTGRAHLGVTVFHDARLLRNGDKVRPPALLVSLRHLGP